MKQVLLASILIFCAIFPALAQNTPIELVKKARNLVKDSIGLVENRKDLILETKALIKDVQNLGKKTKIKRNTEYQIGLNFQAFNFENYTFAEKSKTFNGFAVGLIFRKPLTKHFSFRSELTYTTQSENFISSGYSIQLIDRERIHVYDSKAKYNYNIIKLPLFIDYSLHFGTASTWSIHGYTGLQLGYLGSYINRNVSYQVNSIGREGDFEINYDVITVDSYIRNGDGYGRSLLDPSNTNPNASDYEYYTIEKPKDIIFRLWQVSVAGGLEIEKRINSKFSLAFGGRYEYSLTKTESGQYNAFSTYGKSYQKRIGMTFSVLKTIH